MTKMTKTSKTKISAARKAQLDKREAGRQLDQHRFAAVAKVINHKPTYVEEEDGQRVRVWSDGTPENPSLDVVTDADVRAWLLNARVVELREGLEFLHKKFITGMIRDGMLRKDSVGSFYWVTAKASERYNLPRVLGCKFPPATGVVGRLAPTKFV